MAPTDESNILETHILDAIMDLCKDKNMKNISRMWKIAVKH